jgi:hypothetical protein
VLFVRSSQKKSPEFYALKNVKKKRAYSCISLKKKERQRHPAQPTPKKSEKSILIFANFFFRFLCQAPRCGSKVHKTHRSEVNILKASYDPKPTCQFQATSTLVQYSKVSASGFKIPRCWLYSCTNKVYTIGDGCSTRYSLNGPCARSTMRRTKFSMTCARGARPHPSTASLVPCSMQLHLDTRLTARSTSAAPANLHGAC